jgi:hypothetical protein
VRHLRSDVTRQNQRERHCASETGTVFAADLTGAVTFAPISAADLTGAVRPAAFRRVISLAQ